MSFWSPKEAEPEAPAFDPGRMLPAACKQYHSCQQSDKNYTKERTADQSSIGIASTNTHQIYCLVQSGPTEGQKNMATALYEMQGIPNCSNRLIRTDCLYLCHANINVVSLYSCCLCSLIYPSIAPFRCAGYVQQVVYDFAIIRLVVVNICKKSETVTQCTVIGSQLLALINAYTSTPVMVNWSSENLLAWVNSHVRTRTCEIGFHTANICPVPY